MTPDDVTVWLHRAMDAAVGLSADDIDGVESLIRAGERLVAFETLCTQIYEYDISLDPDLLRRLVEVGRSLGADEGYAALLVDG